MVRPEELAQTLVRRHRERNLAAERRGAELLASSKRALAAAVRSGRIERGWIIGSLVAGHFGERSDVDLVILGGDPAADAALWCELEERLGAPVDLLRFERLPGSFQERVLREGTVVDDQG